MTAIPATDLDRPAELLRHRLVDQLLADGRITTAAVEAAFRAVPRHAFVPEAELEAAYADDTAKTKFDDDGTCLSSLSAPWLQALMVEQAALQPGDSVLEIGSGGYQAALLAEVVTHTGRVVTLDIDPDITDRAAGCLERTGYDRVAVAMGDGETGYAMDAPHGGRTANSTRIRLGDNGATLTFVHGAPDQPDELAGALGHAAAQVWSGVLPGTPGYIGGLQMYLATRMPAVADCPRESLPHPEGVRAFAPVCTTGGNLGYLAVRGAGDQAELGAVAYGPQARQLAEDMATIIADWGRDVRGGPGVSIAVYPRDTADDQLPDGRVIDTTHRRILITWPNADTPQARSAVEA